MKFYCVGTKSPKFFTYSKEEEEEKDEFMRKNNKRNRFLTGGQGKFL